MSNNNEALSQPVAIVVNKYGDPEAFGERELKLLTDIQKVPYNTNFYSQDYVTLLLAENAELKASLSEWEDCKHDGATYHDMSGRERCGRCGADL